MRIPSRVLRYRPRQPQGHASPHQREGGRGTCSPPGSAGKHIPVGTDLFLAQLRAMNNDMSVKAEVLLDGS